VPRARHRTKPRAPCQPIAPSWRNALAELLSNRLIEVLHQRGLLNKAKVALHEFSQLLPKQCQLPVVAAHICKKRSSRRRNSGTTDT